MITAQLLFDALEAANSEERELDQAYVRTFMNDGDLSDCIVDGHVNLVRLAELLNEKLNAK